MTQRDTTIKVAAYGVALVALMVLNYYVLGPLPIPQPLLLLCGAVAVGTLEGPRFGAGFGLAAGLVMATVGHAGLLCVPAVSAIAWGTGLLTQHVLRRDLVGHVLCALCALLLWECWQVGGRLAAGTADMGALLRVAGPELLWSLLFSFPAYWLGRFCCRYYGRIYHE